MCLDMGLNLQKSFLWKTRLWVRVHIITHGKDFYLIYQNVDVENDDRESQPLKDFWATTNDVTH